jgi:sulfite exporter TauE/SafE
MFLAAFIMGLAGSLHCAGMCSPLAMTVTSMTRSVFVNRILYNVGRVATYGLLGAIAAAAGYMIPLGKFQNALSISFGMMFIVMAAVGVTGIRIPFITNSLTRFTGFVKNVFSKFIHRKHYGTQLLLGAVNGLLPCGLTFLALSFCITLPSPIDGIIYMLWFGAGTLPVMLGLISIVDLIKNKLHWNMKHVTTGLMVLSGILLIARVFLLHPSAHRVHDVVEITTCR